MAMAITPDGKKVLSSDGRSDRLLLHDLATARLLKSPLNPGFRVTALAFSPDGGRLLVGGSNGAVDLWDIGRRRRALTAGLRWGGSPSVDFDPSGRTFMWCTPNNVGLVDATTGRQLGAWRPEWPDNPHAVRFTRDGRHVVVATGAGRGRSDNAIHLRDARTFRVKRVLLGHTDLINCLAVSRHGSPIISGSDDGTVRVWKLP